MLTALAPLIPKIFGSAFNIWYNTTVIQPVLTPALKHGFFETVVLYNSIVYPIGFFFGSDEFFRYATCVIAFAMDQ
jgi:hypothetical protein